MNFKLSLFSVLIWTTALVSTLQAGQSFTKVVMTTGSFSEREAAMYVAQDQGFFRRYGVDLTFVHVRNGPVGMAALASGETQLHEGSVTGAVLGSAAEGTDLVFVAGMINKLIGNIMASPKIKSPSDLKGKVIGVTSASGGSWMFTTLALEYWGWTRSATASPFASLAMNPSAAKHCSTTRSRQPIRLHLRRAAQKPRLYQPRRFGPTPYSLPKHRRHDNAALHQLVTGSRRKRAARNRRFDDVYRPTG
jgi:hypothetical protein